MEFFLTEVRSRETLVDELVNYMQVVNEGILQRCRKKCKQEQTQEGDVVHLRTKRRSVLLKEMMMPSKKQDQRLVYALQIPECSV